MKIKEIKEMLLDICEHRNIQDQRDIIKNIVSENYSKENAFNWVREMPELAAVATIREDSGFNDIHNIYDIVKTNLINELDTFIDSHFDSRDNSPKI